MDIGKRLKDVREQKHLSQGDIERRTGLLRCYTSRVENGHTVPSIATIEKMAQALGIPVYQLFVGAEESPNFGNAKGKSPTGKQEREFSRFANLLGVMKERDRKLLLVLGSAMTRHKK